MKTILGFRSSALAGPTAHSIAAAANSGHTVVLHLRFTILYPFILASFHPGICQLRGSMGAGGVPRASIASLALSASLPNGRGIEDDLHHGVGRGHQGHVIETFRAHAGLHAVREITLRRQGDH